MLSRAPLGEVLHNRVGKWLADRGVAIHLGARVQRIAGDVTGVRRLILADGTAREFDGIVVAVPWRAIRGILAEALLAALPELACIDRIEPAAITAVHLWFDRPVTTLPHAVLVGRLSQWVFCRVHETHQASRVRETHQGAANDAANGALHAPYYCHVVISGSHRLPERTHDELVAAVRGDLEAVWPAARQARLLHARVVTQPAAAFSPLPGLEQIRPSQEAPVANLALAGDWTATGWPATMEGAVLSGYRAVEALMR